jgi:hypothetical protein
MACLLVAVAAVAGVGAFPQAQAVPPAQAPRTGRTAAPLDLTGYWVSIVTEDWRWRMVTPPKGDYASVPISAEGKRIADAWDPARDEAAGEQCRSYGAAAIMRVPGRLHITWQDDNTLKVETDAGTQVRLLRFGDSRPPAGDATWQGDSKAEWVMAARGRGPAPPQPPAEPGFLKVTTTHMRPGYLRKNGVPYSADAVLTEYWSAHKEANGDRWLVATVVVDDSKYLQTPSITSSNFKLEANGSKWDPTPCSSTW